MWQKKKKKKKKKGKKILKKFFFRYRSGIGDLNFTTQGGGWNETGGERRQEIGSKVYNCLGLGTFPNIYNSKIFGTQNYLIN